MSNAVMQNNINEFNFFSKKKTLNPIKKRVLKLMNILLSSFIFINGYFIYDVFSKAEIQKQKIHMVISQYNDLHEDFVRNKIDLIKFQNFQKNNLMLNDLIFASLVLSINVSAEFSAKNKEELNRLYEEVWNSGLKNERTMAGVCTVDIACYVLKEYEGQRRKILKQQILENYYEVNHLDEYKKHIKNIQNGKIEEPKWKKYFLEE